MMLRSRTYTAFCQEIGGGGTTWISTVEAESVEQAATLARVSCAEDWGHEPDEVHVLGIASGDVKIEFWEDQSV
jgi:hypothetical protein